MAEQEDANLQDDPLAEIDPLIHAPARLRVMTYLYVVDSIDFVYLKRMTGMSWGNLSTHLTNWRKADISAFTNPSRTRNPTP